MDPRIYMEIGDVIKHCCDPSLCKIVGIGIDTIKILDSNGTVYEEHIDSLIKRYILVKRVSDKFNIFTKVLVRNSGNQIWKAREYEGMTLDGKYMTTSGEIWDQCIRYNSWLHGTCLDPSDLL